ncbi:MULTISPECIES: hypothetical protein [unclassified Paraburkholderia]|uniref:hypothetical protein n=1 Tax=unclassified Paraburkholderia TaxID=2615204 RepID=UPI0016099F67|nr:MULTISPECIES: hypothetical protein [unclassified Paraburkholderia]MBB5445109.1 hypothetical protein [Paraburkholderia sp. WSM4177]MBB5484040.1 hypothetical protein [Paraburkholderia sp. WSM4180]
MSALAEDEFIDEGSLWPFHCGICGWNRDYPTVGNGPTLDDGAAIEQAAADGRLNRLVVRNPAGPHTPYISLLFPGDLLGRLETLGPWQSAIFDDTSDGG